MRRADVRSRWRWNKRAAAAFGSPYGQNEQNGKEADIATDRPAELGLRVLLVEDDYMMSMMVEDELKSLGCSVVSATDLAEGARLATTTELDVGVLDVNITGRPVYPVAEALRRRGIPFIFTTAYIREHLEPEYQAVLRLNKPFRLHDLESALRRTVKPTAS